VAGNDRSMKFQVQTFSEFLRNTFTFTEVNQPVQTAIFEQFWYEHIKIQHDIIHAGELMKAAFDIITVNEYGYRLADRDRYLVDMSPFSL